MTLEMEFLNVSGTGVTVAEVVFDDGAWFGCKYKFPTTAPAPAKVMTIAITKAMTFWRIPPFLNNRI